MNHFGLDCRAASDMVSISPGIRPDSNPRVGKENEADTWPTSPTRIINMEAGTQVWLWPQWAVAATL